MKKSAMKSTCSGDANNSSMAIRKSFNNDLSDGQSRCPCVDIVISFRIENPPTRVGVTSILILCRVQNVYHFQNPKSKIRNPKSKIQNPKSKIQNPKSEIRNPKSKIQNPKSEIQNPKSKIRNPKSKICTKRIAT